MNRITKKEFESINRPLNGVFVFLMEKGCGLCKIYLEELNKYGCDWTIVELDIEDEEWALTQLISNFPITRIMFDDMIVMEKSGVLFPKQIREVYAELEKYT